MQFLSFSKIDNIDTLSLQIIGFPVAKHSNILTGEELLK